MGQKQKKEMDKKLKAFKPLLPFNFQSIYLLEIECKLRLKSLAGKARSALQVKILLSGTWMCLGSLENWILPLFEFFWGPTPTSQDANAQMVKKHKWLTNLATSSCPKKCKTQS